MIRADQSKSQSDSVRSPMTRSIFHVKMPSRLNKRTEQPETQLAQVACAQQME